MGQFKKIGNRLNKRGVILMYVAFYTVGVFLAFTLSQMGLVRHWWHLRETAWKNC